MAARTQLAGVCASAPEGLILRDAQLTPGHVSARDAQNPQDEASKRELRARKAQTLSGKGEHKLDSISPQSSGGPLPPEPWKGFRGQEEHVIPVAKPGFLSPFFLPGLRLLNCSFREQTLVFLLAISTLPLVAPCPWQPLHEAPELQRGGRALSRDTRGGGSPARGAGSLGRSSVGAHANPSALR